MSAQQIALLLGVTLVVFWGVGLYNRLVQLRQAIANAFAQIDVQLKRRHDLIPNLVAVARAYLEHERETLERVVAARNQAVAACEMARSLPGQSGPINSLGQAEVALAGALQGFRAVVEAHPELKADETLQGLAQELTHTENKVAFARQLFNDATLEFNVAVQEFPARLVAGVMGFHPAAMLQATSTEAERAPVKVQL